MSTIKEICTKRTTKFSRDNREYNTIYLYLSNLFCLCVSA